MPKYKETQEVSDYIQFLTNECRVEGGQHAPDFIFESLLTNWFEICGVTRTIKERENIVVELAEKSEEFSFYEEDGLFIGYPGDLLIHPLARACLVVRGASALRDPDNKNISEGILKWTLLVEMFRTGEAKLVVKKEKSTIKLKGLVLEQLEAALQR